MSLTSSVLVKCKECQTELSIAREMQGKRVKCPKCKGGFTASFDFRSVVFTQQLRTPYSEIWLADLGRQSEDLLAQIDIHYLKGGVEVTVALLKDMIEEQDLHEFLQMIDHELVAGADIDDGDLRFRVIQNGSIQVFKQANAQSGD